MDAESNRARDLALEGHKMMPKTKDEYFRRFAQSQKIEGYGPYGLTMHMPCPFCAAPDWMVHLVIDTDAAMKKGATCKECGRSAKAVFTIDEATTTQFEIVQTGGDDTPEWFQPPMRRSVP